MLKIDLNNKTIKGTTTPREIREHGLIEASIRHEEEGTK